MFLRIIFSAVNAAYSFLIFIDAASVFQQCGYRYRDYRLWLNKTRKRRWVRIVFSVFASAALLTAKFAFSLDFISYATLYAVCLYICAYLICGGIKLRVKPKFTFRFTRVILLAFLIYCALSFAIDYAAYYLLKAEASFATVILPVYVYLLPLSTSILSPYEKFRFNLSVRLCKKRLEKRKDLIKIGVTGSCGKTSVKNYLAEMLAYDYKTYVTPKSFNTPLGICIAVKNMPEDTEVFIAEMGAKRRGDIALLAEIVKPEMAIITSVCEQHLETFLSLENIKKAKYELIEGLSENGTAIFSFDDEYTRGLYDKCRLKKISAGINGVDVSAERVSVSGEGTKFIMTIRGKKYRVATKLLGRHNVSDICLAAAAASALGVKPMRIISAISRLKPPPHRLEMSKTSGGVTVIDDGYNANVSGVKSAAEVLRCFEGQKFAVASGIVEGGEKSRTLNEEVGAALKNSADTVIAVGAYSDYIAAGARGGRCNVVKVKDLSEAKKYLKDKVKAGDVVIFINDLPDKYL